jgi:hypothetical protein
LAGGGLVFRNWIQRFPRGRRAGIVDSKARSTVFTDSAFWKTRATSGSSKTATDPGRTRLAKRFGLAFV